MSGYPVRRSALNYQFTSVQALRRTEISRDGGGEPHRNRMVISVKAEN